MNTTSVEIAQVGNSSTIYRIAMNNDLCQKSNIFGKDEFDSLEEAMMAFNALDLNDLNKTTNGFYELEMYIDGEIAPFPKAIAEKYGFLCPSKDMWITRD